MLRKTFFYSTKKKWRKKISFQTIRKFSASTIPLFSSPTHSLQSIPPPSALIVAQKFGSVWCSYPKNNKNPTASRVSTVGNDSLSEATDYASTSPPGF